MENETIEKTAEDEVPFWMRANITARDLAALKMRVTELEKRVEQGEKEYDFQNEMVKTLIDGLGFDACDWELSQKGIEDALKCVIDEVAVGKLTEEEFGTGEYPDKTTVVSRFFEQRQTIARLRGELGQVTSAIEFHPRAWRLMVARRNFVVVAEDEPFYESVYRTIRVRAIGKRTWTQDDERAFEASMDRVYAAYGAKRRKT